MNISRSCLSFPESSIGYFNNSRVELRAVPFDLAVMLLSCGVHLVVNLGRTVHLRSETRQIGSSKTLTFFGTEPLMFLEVHVNFRD